MNNRTPGPTENPNERFYHGTRAQLEPGDSIEPSDPPDDGERDDAYVYLTPTLDAAIWDAELAIGEGAGRVYVVEPTGAIEDASDVAGQKPPGHPSMSWRSRAPLRVTGEVTEWNLFHGTKADLKPGDLIEPGRTANFGNVRSLRRHQQRRRDIRRRVQHPRPEDGSGFDSDPSREERSGEHQEQHGPRFGHDREYGQMGKQEDHRLNTIRPDCGHPAGQAASDQTPKEKFLRKSGLNHTIEERCEERRGVQAGADERSLSRALATERVGRRRPNEQEQNDGTRGDETVEQIPGLPDAQPSPTTDLMERPAVSRDLIPGVDEGREADEEKEIAECVAGYGSEHGSLGS